MMKRQLHVADKGHEPVDLGIGKVPVYRLEHLNKVSGFGLVWTSTLKQSNGRVTSDWLDWAERNGFYLFGDVELWEMIPEESTEILTIDSLTDYLAVLDEYSEKEEVVIEGRYQKVLDFERIASDFDAIHLTKKGERETKHNGLYGWDVESTVWFRWCFESVKKIEGGEVGEYNPSHEVCI